MKEISVTKVGNISIGQTEDSAGATGCTVFISEKGMPAGLDIRGGGPASRETAMLDPIMAMQKINALVIGGGSAFGLDAAGGVMACLEEHGIGFDVGITRVPLVVQSDIFDLTVGDMRARPDRRMGYEAAKAALLSPNYRDGNYGAGCGATVGKLRGMERCMKTGIGSFAMQTGELKIGAVVVLNALGDVFDIDTGRQIAGILNEERNGFGSTAELMKSSSEIIKNKFVGNTTIAAVITNAAFEKPQLCKIAGMAQDGMARSVIPVHTSADGDSIYALSVGDLPADIDLVGTLAAEAVSRAIVRAVTAAESAYGFPAAGDIAARLMR